MLKYLAYPVLTVIMVTAILQMVNPRNKEIEIYEELKISVPYKSMVG